jgi:predicted phosphodiesterase
MVNRRVLVVSDLHIPFHHKSALDFCKRIYKDLKCNEVVMIGDLVDNHAISYHDHDPDGWSPEDEMREADRHLKVWFKAFPEVSLCCGNHDRLIDRKSKTVGLPSRAFRSFRDMWNLPKGWKDDFYHIIDGVKYTHGTSYSGNLAHLKAAHDNRMSTVIGHLHSVCGIDYTANENDCIWGMSVGCLIDRHTYAFSYGRDFKSKPILAVGVVEHTKYGANPRLFRMDI